MKINQKGFTVVEVLLIILILGVFSFGGYYVWHNQHNSKNSNSSASAVQQNKSVSQPNYPSLNLATSQLQAVYTKWVTQHTDTSEDSTAFIKNSGYFTSNFSSNARTNFDPLTCGGSGNSIPPDSFSLGTPTQSNGTATASVHNTFQGSDYSTVVVTMKAEDNTWLISQTSCP